eukprot:scaffold19290_cov113-Skeletonema_dohrnii-CCMP3373.AAC.1
MSHAQLPPGGGGVGGTLIAPAGGGVGGGATGMLREREVVRTTGKQAIMSFLETQTCYSVLRASGKVVVFDTRIPIQLAFYALVEHGELIVMFMIILKYCERAGSIFICSGEGELVIVTLLNNNMSLQS